MLFSGATKEHYNFTFVPRPIATAANPMSPPFLVWGLCDMANSSNTRINLAIWSGLLLIMKSFTILCQ